jgi:hypothetical protein
VSATSQDGLSWESNEDSNESGIVIDAINDDADSFDDSNIKHKSITVENSYLEEKEIAVAALKEICHNVGRNFDVYLEVSVSVCSKLLKDNCKKILIPKKCMEEILPLVDFPDGDLSSAAVLAITEVSFFD